MINTNVVILAAGRGSRLAPLTDNLPKGMVPLHGKPLLSWTISHLKQFSNHNLTLIGGYCSEKLSQFGLPIIENKKWNISNMVYSWWCSKELWNGPILTSYSDIIYSPKVIEKLFQQDGEIIVAVDSLWKDYWELRFDNILSDAESLKINEEGFITSIGQKETSISSIEGQYIGLILFSKKSLDKISKIIDQEIEANQAGRSIICQGKIFEQLFMTDLIHYFANHVGGVKACQIQGQWLEIDNYRDLQIAEKLTQVSETGLIFKR